MDASAHLFCELLTRYEAVGLADGDSFELAITQEHLADALGLSVVHVNRVLQRLRSDGLIETRSRRLKVLDRERLETVAEFDPAYLRPRAPSRSLAGESMASRFPAALPERVRA